MFIPPEEKMRFSSVSVLWPTQMEMSVQILFNCENLKTERKNMYRHRANSQPLCNIDVKISHLYIAYF